MWRQRHYRFFCGGWGMSEFSEFPTVQLEDAVDVLDHLRVPVNGADRLGRTGVVPYYGANGLQGWIDKPLFDEPLILLAEDGGNFDDFANRPIAYRIEGPSWINNHAHVIRAKTGICQSFIFWSLVNKDIRRFIAGGTRTKLTQGELRCIEISLPGVKEQQAIAQVLDTIDTTIRKTEVLIDKLKAVKQGLLHDLLTRGINANGELRPPQSEAPQLYKESPLGWIPIEWEVCPLYQQADVIDPQPDHRTPKEQEDGVLYVGIGDFDEHGRVRASSCRRVVQSALVKQRERFEIEDGDIVYGKIGTIGKPKRLISGDYALTANVLLLKPKYSPALFFMLLSSAFESQILDITNTTSQPALGIETVRNLLVFKTASTESELISGRLNSLFSQICEETAMLHKLQQQRSGLMDDLLTGRVRATPLLQGPSY